MANADGDLGGAVGFGHVLGTLAEGDKLPEGVTSRIVDGEPYVIYRTTGDLGIANTGLALARIVMACVSTFDATDGAVEGVTIIGIPQDRERHPGAGRWRLDAAVARERLDGSLSRKELLDRVDATNEIVEDTDDLELDL